MEGEGGDGGEVREGRDGWAKLSFAGDNDTVGEDDGGKGGFVCCAAEETYGWDEGQGEGGVW